MALLPKEKKELQQDFEKQLQPDLVLSFEENGIVYKFNFDKSESGDYIDSFTQGVWEGFQDAEGWEKNGKHQKVKLPECPVPVEGWCDCGKCKTMMLHKEKNIYVCLVCHKQTEPFLPIGLNSNDWLPDESEY
ncbi:exodeoxyribonuclease V subunit beta [Salmonella enterica]|uniref:exodeoxyribonuclease V subunit beta n=1 Tax=Citrobacter cronae TaxID=1748967 RepID=UPI001D2F3427|nr:exodeoxyribonuclease V subunit beta [Citrobacter cronae]EAX9402771.1 exodeoxyribonuclease V subunit beta [Salmonella enterica]EEG3323365.1 exodeoxyribonuclease V subunit beta [Salmonella enterica]